MFLLKVSKGDALDSRFHNAGMTIPRIILSWCSSIPESFMSLVDDGQTAWLIVSELLISFKRLYRWFPNACAKPDNRDCAAQRHQLPHHVLTLLAKPLPNVLFWNNKVQILHKWRQDTTSVILSFPNVLTMSQITLVKLIVTVICKIFSLSFGLRQLRQPALPRLRIFPFARTKLLVSYVMLIQ